MPRLWNVSSDELGFDPETLPTVPRERFLEKCPHFANADTKWEWGDTIQVDSHFRDENKFIWDGDRWVPFDTTLLDDDGVLPMPFSVVHPDKDLPANFFDSVAHHADHVPWDPLWYADQLRQNARLDQKSRTLMSTFGTGKVHTVSCPLIDGVILERLVHLSGNGGGHCQSYWFQWFDVTADTPLPLGLRPHVEPKRELYRKGDRLTIRHRTRKDFDSLLETVLLTLDPRLATDAFVDDLFSSRYLQRLADGCFRVAHPV